MTSTADERRRKALVVRAFLTRYDVRLVLSVLILLSICPFSAIDRIWWFFFPVFGIEFVSRTYVLLFSHREQEKNGSRVVEALLLLLDFVAWVSFLPLDQMTGLRVLRAARFSRLVLLFGYWGSTFRLLWSILNREERTRQLKLLFGGVLGLTFVSAVILAELGAGPRDAQIGLANPSFFDMVWWSFRQIQDPGNLVSQANHLPMLLVSLTMTIGGLFLFSFFIGIGTSVVAELIQTSRERPVGYRGHSVAINAGNNIHFFVGQVIDYYDKQLRKPRWVLLGSEQSHPGLLAKPKYRRISYREGSACHREDLAKVDAHSARRIVVFALAGLDDPDPDTISSILSTRQVNSRALIYAEIFDEGNHSAALAAGGASRTFVISTENLLAAVTANLIAVPESHPVIVELFTAHGNEIYSYVYGLEGEPFPAAPKQDDFTNLLVHAYQNYRCVLLGLGTPESRDHDLGSFNFQPVLNPTGAASCFPEGESIKALVAVAPSFDSLADFARAYHQTAPEAALSLSPYKRADLEEELVLPAMNPSAVKSNSKVLLCGFRNRSALLIAHIIRIMPDLELFIMVSNEDKAERAKMSLLNQGLDPAEVAGPRQREFWAHGAFEERKDGRLTYLDRTAGNKMGAIEFVIGDWSSRTDLMRPRDSQFDLFELNEIVIQAGPIGQSDPDAKTVLSLLKLAYLHGTEPYRSRFQSDIDITAEIHDPTKAELLKQRLSNDEGGERLCFNIVNTEQLRNVLLFQSTVVPGFGGIFRDLFAQGGQGFQRMTFSTSPAPKRVHFSQLLEHLHRNDRVILIGVELENRATCERRAVVVPNPEAPEAEIDLSLVRALYVVGNTSDSR